MAIKLREDQMMLVERVLQNIKEDNMIVINKKEQNQWKN